MNRFRIELLGEHTRSSFGCGNARIDDYFHRYVTQDIKRSYSLCYVLIENTSNRLAGFFTLSSHSVPVNEVPEEYTRKLPRYPNIPAVLIGWLGRSLAFKGQGLGDVLLAAAIDHIIHSTTGTHLICADAIDESAAAFYKANGFIAFKHRSASFYMPIKTAKELLRP